jgi:hypothetical protein
VRAFHRGNTANEYRTDPRRAEHALENIDADLEHEYDDKHKERNEELIAEYEATREGILAALKELDGAAI